ncbi:integrase/recombinase xerD homolog [Discoglossus pictus]
MEVRSREVVSLIRNSLAPSTWSAYRKVWFKWADLVAAAGGEESDDQRLSILLRFILQCKDAGMSAASVSSQVTALAFMFKLAGQKDLTKEFLVRRVLKGLARGQSSKDKRRPVTFLLLLHISVALEEVCHRAYEALLFRTAFSLAFFGAFRLGELVATSKHGPCGMQVEDVWVEGDRVVLWLRRSKTDQAGHGKEIMLRRVRTDCCPVDWVDRLLQLRPGLPGPLLIHLDGLALSCFQFSKVFKSCLSKLGLCEAEFGTLSFRIGAATEAAGLGLPDEVLKRIGRWQSSRFKLYIQLASVAY